MMGLKHSVVLESLVLDDGRLLIDLRQSKPRLLKHRKNRTDKQAGRRNLSLNLRDVFFKLALLSALFCEIIGDGHKPDQESMRKSERSRNKERRRSLLGVQLKITRRLLIDCAFSFW
jgi:hypothetical protein